MRLVFPIVLLSLWPVAGQASTAESIRALLSAREDWRWVTHGPASGLPAGRVVAIESDGDGAVWVGTSAGLKWFDGYQFLAPSISHQANHPPAIPGDIRRIARLGNGDIAIHAGSSVWIGRSGQLRAIPAPAKVSQIAPLGSDGLFVTTTQGHFWMRHDTWTPVPTPVGSNRVFPGSNGKPWLLVPGLGLLHWGGERWLEKPVLTQVQVYEVVIEGGGILTASARSPSAAIGLWELEVQAKRPPHHASPEIVRAMALADDGQGIAVFESGDVRVRLDGQWVSLRDSYHSALLRRATSLFLRPNGEVWAGTNGGINVFRSQTTPLRPTRFDSSDGRNNVNEIVRRRNGELWLATSNGLVVQSAAGEWRSILEVAGQRLGVVTGLNEDSAGNLWVSSGSAFGGAYRLAGASQSPSARSHGQKPAWSHWQKKEGLTDWPIHRIRKDRSGNLWFLSNVAAGRGHPEEAGATEWDGQRFRFLGQRDGMPNPAVVSFAQAPDGALWFGTNRGLSRFSKGQWAQFDANSGITGGRVFDVAVAPDGAVWFCHQRTLAGIGRLNRRANGSADVRYFTETDGVPSNEVWAVSVEADGHVWAATVNGVAVSRGSAWVSAGTGYGIDGVKIWPLLLEKNDLWFGTIGQGIVHIDRSERLAANPRLFLQTPVLKEEQWTVSWRALARDGAIRPADVLTRFRVDAGANGPKAGWEPWSAIREHSISASKYGPHRIEVQSVGALGDVDAQPAALTFTIPHPFYLRPDLLSVLAVLLLTAVGTGIQMLRSRTRYTRELEIAKQKAEDSGKARGAFLAAMSHEIRTPMNGVLGMTTIMLDTSLDPHQRSYVETIRNSAEALLSVINDILDFSKIESGKFQITPAPFDLEDTCEQVVTLLASRAAEKSLVLAVDYPPSLPKFVIGDGGRVRQILLNLAGNAIKFTDAGWVRITVESMPLHATGEETVRLRLRVDDTGIGIPAQKISQLFEEFSQVDSSAARRHGGTGLGLAISKKLTEHMGGSIQVESTEGQGSSFSCELPFPLGLAPNHPPMPPLRLSGGGLILYPEPFVRQTLAAFCAGLGLEVRALAAPLPLPIDACPFILTAECWHGEMAVRLAGTRTRLVCIDDPHALNSLLPLSRRRLRAALAEHPRPPLAASPFSDLAFSARILVVEDNLTNQRVTRLMLEKMGNTVVVAGDGAQAVQLCQHQTFDLILMDMQMPVMDGLEATRLLRALSHPNASVPIVALTANAMEEDRQRCLDAGMSGYLAKPVVREALAAMLRLYLMAEQPGPDPFLVESTSSH